MRVTFTPHSPTSSPFPTPHPHPQKDQSVRSTRVRPVHLSSAKQNLVMNMNTEITILKSHTSAATKPSYKQKWREFREGEKNERMGGGGGEKQKRRKQTHNQLPMVLSHSSSSNKQGRPLNKIITRELKVVDLLAVTGTMRERLCLSKTSRPLRGEAKVIPLSPL